MNFDDKIGIFDPTGVNMNPLTNQPFSDNYKDLAKTWSTYPAYAKAEEILESISSYQLTILVSGTGSGKTVLVPKFALHYTGYKGLVVMTLPKRRVTISSARFAASTLDIKLGEELGYVYKGSDKSMINKSNRMIYMTDGTLLAKFMTDPKLLEYSVVIIDEAHERSSRIDQIMLAIKNLLQSGLRPDLRVIIMSATIDTTKYTNYFSDITSNVVNVSGAPNYPITVHYANAPVASYMATGLEIIGEIGKADTLFFVSTSNEAQQICNSIRPTNPRTFCIEVYADMDDKLQIYAEHLDKYHELGEYDRKVVIATNVAESSVTINGLKYVVDSGYELYSYFDPMVCADVLEKRFITQAQVLQRRGRVGRVEPGVSYLLLTQQQFANLEKYPAPEILRQDITIDFLKIIKSAVPNKSTVSNESNTHIANYANGYQVLMQLMDVPKKSYIDLAHDLYKLYDIIDATGNLTPLGYTVSEFSSLTLAQVLFIIYAYKLHCAKEACIIISMVEKSGGKFNRFFRPISVNCKNGCKRIDYEAEKAHAKKFTKKRGDHLSMLHLYELYEKSDNVEEWAKTNRIRVDMLSWVKRSYRNNFSKILSLNRKQQTGGELNSVSKNILSALQQSHAHLTAIKSEPVYGKKKINGHINKDSTLLYHYKKKDLDYRKIIYDELTMINGKYEFNVVTLLK